MSKTRMKKYMIRCDIEGVSGVVSYEQAEPGKPEFEFGKRMFMSDLLALIDGLNQGGADEIWVYDEHYYGRNIDINRLPKNVTSICGKPPYRADWAGGLDESFTGMILLGFHSKFDNKNGLLHHSYELDIKDLRINGISVGEIGMEAAIAGDYNVPVLMMTGDSAGVEEAKKLLSCIAVVVVKESICEWGAQCYPLSVTAEKIRTKAEEIVKNKPNVKPYNVGNKVSLEVELNEGHYLDVACKLYGNEMVNSTFVFKGKSATDVWAQYWQKKLNIQKQM